MTSGVFMAINFKKVLGLPAGPWIQINNGAHVFFLLSQ